MLAELARERSLKSFHLRTKLTELSKKFPEIDPANHNDILVVMKELQNVTGYYQKQKCTNKDCNYIGVVEDLSGLCDICYHPTLRVVE